MRAFLVLTIAFAFVPRFELSAAEVGRNVEDYRRFALTHDGNPVRGQQLFNDEKKLICAKCHSVNGSTSKAGPDLQAAGDVFGRRDLVDAVLAPSANIVPGYGTVIVETKTGEMYTGVLKGKTEAQLQLMGADARLVSIPTAEIKEQKGSPTSLMPEGQQASLSLQEFTDLIEYLTTLKQPESAQLNERGMPSLIPKLSKPVTVRPFLTNQFELLHAPAETGLTSFRQIPGVSNLFLVLHQKGTIWKIEKTPSGERVTVFAKLSDEVFSERGPNGLLDLTFHPKFRENRKYYLYYQVFEQGKVATHIVEKQFDPEFGGDCGKKGRLIIRIESVAEDHSGGCLQFGPEGFLYFGMGDTGPHNDPNGHAQNLAILLGKMIRIDVDHEDAGLAYSVPKDNPFCGQAGVRPEIWALGLRNPWRFCFDRANGDLWLADVGQDRVEEVDIVHRGENYGWNVYEGFEPFSNQFRKEGRNYTMPLFAYRRKYGNSITGGCVYRGGKNASFDGIYVCGDYNSKRIFGLSQEKGVLQKVRQIGVLPQRLVSFSEDETGNMYAVGYDGRIYELDFGEAQFE
jgi:putative heme-binding domain-containing protein